MEKPVIITTNSYGVVISGTNSGDICEIYSMDGFLLSKTTADGNETSISCPQGINIVKIGNKSVKVVVK